MKCLDVSHYLVGQQVWALRLSPELSAVAPLVRATTGDALLRRDGWYVNHKRVARIWRREGLRVPQKQPKRGRRSQAHLNGGSCVRLRPERPNHVWAYDFVQDRTRDGRKFRMLTVIDEFSRE